VRRSWSCRPHRTGPYAADALLTAMDMCLTRSTVGHGVQCLTCAGSWGPQIRRLHPFHRTQTNCAAGHPGGQPPGGHPSHAVCRLPVQAAKGQALSAVAPALRTTNPRGLNSASKTTRMPAVGCILRRSHGHTFLWKQRDTGVLRCRLLDPWVTARHQQQQILSSAMCENSGESMQSARRDIIEPSRDLSAAEQIASGESITDTGVALCFGFGARTPSSACCCGGRCQKHSVDGVAQF
jgi:hypothetical protein